MDHVITTKHKSIIPDLPFLFRRSLARLMQNDPLRMAGATAFFTSFALPFILLLITQFLSLLIDPQKLRRELFGDLVSIFGRESVRQVVDTLIAFRELADNLFITLIGFVFLLLVATTLLMIVKGSINQIWRIKVGEGRSFVKQLGTRLKSVLIIVATGILVIINIVAEAAKAHMGRSISALSTTIALYFNNAFTYVLSLVVVTVWFGIIFRLLPDGRPTWKVAFTGAFVTAILFNIGKILLRVLLTYSNLNSLYGTSASVVLILLFVFYSSLIMYFGASFTRVWAEYVQQPIKLLPYATRYKVMEIKK
jgi:membrane protein